MTAPKLVASSELAFYTLRLVYSQGARLASPLEVAAPVFVSQIPAKLCETPGCTDNAPGRIDAFAASNPSAPVATLLRPLVTLTTTGAVVDGLEDEYMQRWILWKWRLR